MEALSKIDIKTNPDGWGPTSDNIIPEVARLPFVPFNKLEKNIRICDVGTRPGTKDKKNETLFGEMADIDISNFNFVENKTATKTKVKVDRFKRPNYQNRFARKFNQTRQNQPETTSTRGVNRTKKASKYSRAGWYSNVHVRRFKEPSVETQSDWVVINEMSKVVLDRQSLRAPEGETLKITGSLSPYDKVYGRVSTKKQIRLKPDYKTQFFNVSTSDDQAILDYAGDQTGNIFITDSILSTLMSAGRSQYSWDIVVNKYGNVLFFDKRDGSAIDFVNTFETANEYNAVEEKESIDYPRNLSKEATMINQFLSQQLLKKDVKKDFEEDHIAEGDEYAARKAYSYRKYELGQHKLIVRCTLDAYEANPYAEEGASPEFVSIKAANEFLPSKKSNWKTQLDSSASMGVVIPDELKNNAAKYAKWVLEASLADVPNFHLAFVTRDKISADPENKEKKKIDHAILGVYDFKTEELAKILNLNMANAWGIINLIVQNMLTQEDGKYVIFKDPLKPIVRVYSVPAKTFESSDEEDD
eukprot:CAMPEP_0114988044 /NCGR_PEP_ID=MMETSP0216-20121206/9365_1 /TAXON_ID=223996 /ORGANISM="Protocruzia adherens, Strain Boccale" /LENGTH=529 /DNA_ID=CAMNT_0002350751 /DNA_START=813 /DNA_END=2402 /DNA_ORIENTATION=+